MRDHGLSLLLSVTITHADRETDSISLLRQSNFGRGSEEMIVNIDGCSGHVVPSNVHNFLFLSKSSIGCSGSVKIGQTLIQSSLSHNFYQTIAKLQVYAG